MKLLVLEDSGDFARVLTSVLQGAGIDVTHCADGAAVREELVRQPPDVMLIDADTNGQIGLDILRDIRRNPTGAHIPVILTSAILFAHEEPIRRACDELAVNRFIPRPIQVLDLEVVLLEASRQRPSPRVPISQAAPSQSSTRSEVSTPAQWKPGRHGDLPEYNAVRSRAKAGRPSTPRRSRKSRLARSTSTPKSPVSQATDAMMTLRRLRRETLHLEGADDWTVLGIPRTRDVEHIEVARQRMADRYTSMAGNEGYSDEIHEMARAIAAKVEKAAKSLTDQAARAVVNVAPEPASLPPLPEEPDKYAPDPAVLADQLFLKGQTALASGDPRTAIHHLRQARNEHLGSARNMAWLGWAFYQDKDRPLVERRAQALELLELADQFDPDFLDGQFFLATVEAENQMNKRAAARLRRLLKMNTQHMGARRLYERVQNTLSSQDPAGTGAG